MSLEKNLFVILPVLIGIGVAGFFLFQDYHPAPKEEDEEISRETIGELILGENNVKRQFGNDVLWDSIGNHAPLFNKDSIRTGKDSSAAIRLSDSSVIEIGENSLIVLDKTQQSLGINFKAGDIVAKNSTQGLEIKIKDSVIKGAGSELKIKSGSDSQASIEVNKGKAMVTDKNKRQFEIHQQEQAGFTDTGIDEVSKIAVSLRLPENKTQIQTNKNDFRQPFTWEVTRPDIKTEQFEISRSKQFKPENTQILKAHQATTATLAQGLHFWRVGWTNKGKTVYTETRQLTVGFDKRLELTYPENDTRFEFEPEENNVELQWRSQIPVKVYVVEVSTTPDFKNIAFTKTQSDTKVQTKDLMSHLYYWRVRAFSAKNDELATSPAFTFTLKVRLPKLPELIIPLHEADWETPSPVDFTWKKLDKALEYRISITRDQDQKEVVKTKTHPLTHFMWEWSQPSPYYWSVKALGPHGTVIAASEVRRLNIKPRAKASFFTLVYPKDKSEVVRDSTENPEPILFQWQTARPAPGPMTLTLSKDPEFKEALKQDGITRVSQAVKLKDFGMYYWRLTSESPDKKVFEKSEIGSFKLKLSNSALAPQLIEPANREKVEFVEKDVAVKFKWKPVQPAPQYHIVVERVDMKTNQRITVIDRVVNEPGLTSNPLTEGNYIWTVSGLDAQGQETSTSRPGEFFVIPQELMDAPKLNAPVIK